MSATFFKTSRALRTWMEKNHAAISAANRRVQLFDSLYPASLKKHPELGTRELATFKANKKACAFFDVQAPYYKKLMAGWVMTAKRDETAKAKRR